MTIPRTGAAPSRPIRRSDLVFGWRASDLALNAYTGQPGRFLIVDPGTLDQQHTIDGRNGVSLLASKGMPRWEQVSAQGNIPRLGLIGDVTTSAVERLEWDLPMKVMSLSMYVKVWPLYTPPGTNLGAAAGRILLSLGSNDIGGGIMPLRRINDTWQVFRQRAAATLSSVVTESGSAVFPMELLATLAVGGVIQLTSRDASGSVVTGSTATNANMLIPTELWGDQLIYSQGGKFRLEEIKLARNVHTFASIGALS